MEEVKKEHIRLSNFEMLRIFAMVLIIMHYFMNASDHKTDNVLFEFINIYASRIGVAIFAMLTGYFGYSKKYLKFGSCFDTVIEYSVLNIVEFIIVAAISFSVNRNTLLHIFFPISSSGNLWYVTAYLFVCLIHPYVNKIVHKMKYTGLISVILILQYYLVGRYLMMEQTGDYLYYTTFYVISECVIFYICGLNIRKYKILNNMTSSVLASMMAVVFIIFMFGMGFDVNTYIVTAMSVPLAALSLFCLFGRMEFRSEIVNRIAKCCFGVYVYHHNSVFVSIFIAPLLIKKSDEQSAFITFFIMCAFIIYAFIVDYVRIYGINRCLTKEGKQKA